MQSTLTLASVKAQPTETPEAHMLRLGQMFQQTLQARINANKQGLEAIKKALWQVSDAIEAEQTALLAAHPELIMLATQEGGAL